MEELMKSVTWIFLTYFLGSKNDVLIGGPPRVLEVNGTGDKTDIFDVESFAHFAIKAKAAKVF